jgi:Tetracyclin repressor-like, C-terminal domain
LRVIGLISSYTLSEARMAHDAARAAGAGASWTFEDLVRQLVDERRFPRLYQIAWSAGEPGDRDEQAEFAFGLETILDGVQAMIDRIQPGQSQPGQSQPGQSRAGSGRHGR